MISVVIPAYKRKDGVFKLLESVYRQKDASFEVIVVDDQCPEKTGEAVAQRFPQVRVFRQEVNGGPTAARNRGIREARGNIIVGLDSDATLPEDDTLASVESVFKAYPSVDGLAFRLLARDGTSDDIARWWHPLPIKEFSRQAFITDYFSGTAFAFRTKSVIAAGLFAEIYFILYEENELAYRVLDGGGTILYCPNLVAVHHEDPAGRSSESRTFYKRRNQILFALGVFPILTGVRYMLPRLGKGVLEAIWQMRLGIYAKALLDAARLAPARWKDRRPLQKETLRRIALIRRGAFRPNGGPARNAAGFPGCPVVGLAEQGQPA
jgi:GT2 family glycosyltransferase